AAAGFRVAAPLLPGHGTTGQELNRVGWQDWYDTLEREYRALQRQCRAVFMCGLSLGGSLTLRMAEHHPEIAGIVVVNPAVVPTPAMWFAPLLSIFTPCLKSAVGSDIAMPDVDEHTYDVTPLHGVCELNKLFADVRARLDLVSCPVLLFRSAVDHVVPKVSSETMLRQISSENVTERVLARSYHVATMDYDKEEIFTGSIDFFNKCSAL
ncbi:MAG: alpha/beta fold hydrolase, partial [Propionibacteriaceae bacterium]|nr:alpha/beta fold hydrolase [Propionibacteriaceae bacterium]